MTTTTFYRHTAEATGLGRGFVLGSWPMVESNVHQPIKADATGRGRLRTQRQS